MLTADVRQAARADARLRPVRRGAGRSRARSAGRIREWLARGYAGDMGYLPRTARLREDVRRVLPSAQSVIVTGTVYNTDRPYSVEVTDPAQALVSRYAWGDDYHDVVGARLDRLLDWMRAEHAAPFEARAFVDTGPGPRAGATPSARASGGSENTAASSTPTSGRGSSSPRSSAACRSQPDEPVLDRCGTCTLCLEACPTGAIVEPRVLDATRCLSYLTIELRREIPEPLRARGRHPRLRVRHLPGRVSVEPDRRQERRSRLAAAAGPGPSAACATCGR